MVGIEVSPAYPLAQVLVQLVQVRLIRSEERLQCNTLTLIVCGAGPAFSGYDTENIQCNTQPKPDVGSLYAGCNFRFEKL